MSNNLACGKEKGRGLAFGAIKSYLVNRGLAKWRLADWNPFEFFGKYIKSTKEGSGKTGIWFRVLIFSGVSAIILGWSEGLIRSFPNSV